MFYISRLFSSKKKDDIDGLMQEVRNSIAKALQLRRSCTNLSIYRVPFVVQSLISVLHLAWFVPDRAIVDHIVS